MIQRQLIKLTLYGAATGLVAGLIVLAFRWLIETSQATFLPGGRIGDYETLEPSTRFLLPVVGGLVIGWLFERVPAAARQVGVVYVLSRLRSSAGGQLSLKNFLVQFLFGTAAIVTGHSVDREGPGVHLGSTCGSFIGESARLPHRDRRTLIACGAAASVAAAFNTPLAGAIFGIEVLRFRYHIARFMPVILAAVVGTVVVRLVRGPTPSFLVPEQGILSVLELPIIALLGLLAGGLAGLFTASCQSLARRFNEVRPLLGFLLAGVVTGLLAQAVPQIMGVGYDTLEAMLAGRVAAPLLLGIVVCKLAATAVAVGFRVPGGLIGPTLVMGGAMGGLLHFLVGHLLPGEVATPGFYSIIGMVAMMGAALQAPMAALIALLELTEAPGVILPGMLAVVGADITCRLLMGRESVFVALLRVFRSDATEQAEPLP